LSFVISAAQDPRRSRQRFDLSLDRINSAHLIRQARLVYWRYLHGGGSPTPPPRGVVLQGHTGRVVFGWPTLLPDEHFVPSEWLQGRGLQPSGRLQRSRTSADPPWTPPSS
jgi:hypothetical protein